MNIVKIKGTIVIKVLLIDFRRSKGRRLFYMVIIEDFSEDLVINWGQTSLLVSDKMFAERFQVSRNDDKLKTLVLDLH